MEGKTKEFRINVTLDQSRQARAISSDGQIYLEQLKRAGHLVDEAVKRSQPAGSPQAQSDERGGWSGRSPSRGRSHHNVGILGPRGAGKTSVLLTLLKLIGPREDRDGIDTTNWGEGSPDWEQLASDVDVAGLIEPSQMERGEHVVAAVFATLLSRAKEHLRCCPPLQAKDSRHAEDFLRVAQQVTELLPALLEPDRLAHASREGDEALYDELVKFRWGYNLEQALWSFVSAYLQLVGKKLVVLGFDDVDLAWERGHEVLESLRRYLTSPKMLIFVSGDLGLFAANLNDTAQWRPRHEDCHGGPGATARAGEGSLRQRDLTAQYLKKLLPPHLRLHLPDLRLSKLTSTIEVRRANGDEYEKFDPTFGRLVAHCLSSRDRSDAAALELRRCYGFLVPGDVRHFLELCELALDVDEAKKPKPKPKPKDGTGQGGDTVDKAKVQSNDADNSEAKHKKRASKKEPDSEWLFRFAQVWQRDLDDFGLGPRALQTLVEERHPGLRALNLMAEHPRLGTLALRLDPRTDVPEVGAALAFLSFAFEAHMRREALPHLLRLALEFYVPAHYLMHEMRSDEELACARRELSLQLLDSHRRLYRRFVPWLLRRHGGRGVPGVLPLCIRAGQLYEMLDLHDGSPKAAWRAILEDPETRDFHQARREAADRCESYLGGGRADFFANKPATMAPSLPEISGTNWAGTRLPGLLCAPGARRALTLRRGKAKQEPNPSRERPTLPELLPSPALFREVAGALPRAILGCWCLQDESNSYLSIWQGLSLVVRVMDRMGEYYLTESEPAIAMLFKIVRSCLTEHLEETGGPAPSGAIGPPASAGSANSIELEGMSRKWLALAGELRHAEDPVRLFPGMGPISATEKKKRGQAEWMKRCAAWSRPVDIKPTDPNGAPVGPRRGVAWPSLFAVPRPETRLESDTIAIRTGPELQACRLQAWSYTLDRLALAITEWGWFWWKVLAKPEETKGVLRCPTEPVVDSGTQTLARCIATFFEEIGNDPEYAGTWSGAGDAIQRWVQSFLNSVLVHTSVLVHAVPTDPSGKAPEPQRPALRRGIAATRPPRGRADEPADQHALFANLTSLAANEDESETHWTWGWPFLALASFPTLALFLPDASPLPRIEHDDSAPECPTPLVTLTSGSGESTTDLAWIVRFGGLPLLPLRNLEDERKKAWEQGVKASPLVKPPRDPSPTAGALLDLAGLSWCGLDLCDEEGRPLTKISERRTALVEMLNALMIECPVAAEAKPYVADLALAVKGALDTLGERARTKKAPKTTEQSTDTTAADESWEGESES